MRVKRASSRATFDSGVDEELKDILNRPENGNRCGECGNLVPTWCSTNLGIFLCGRCASVHRKILGTNADDESGIFSNVKSLSMERWTSEEVDSVISLGGNKGNQRKWNPHNEPFVFDGDEDKSAVETFIRNKYIIGKFRDDEVMPSDFGSYRSGGRRRANSRYDDDDEYDDYGMPRNRSRSRSLGNRSRASSFYRSGSSSHLSKYDRAHQKFGRELRELRDRGYTNEDDNIDALTYSHGDVYGAIDYLKRRDDNLSRGSSRATGQSSAPTSKVDMSHTSTTSNPPLPTRKPQGPKPAVFDGTNVIQPGLNEPKTAVFDGTVQQYYDPATGMVYVDQQQYMMAMQQQQLQQQQLQQQQLQQAQMVQQMQPQVQYGVAPVQPLSTGVMPQGMMPQGTMQQGIMPSSGTGIAQYPQMQQGYQQQIDKNSIMNLYNRPDQYTTPVEITPNHPQYQQIMQQQYQNQNQFGL